MGGSGTPSTWCHRPLAASNRYHGRSFQPSFATRSTASSTNENTASDRKYVKFTRTQPGLMPSHPSAICSWNSCDVVMSMPSSRCPYGPAHEQPPRAWIPNRSFSSATTKLWCR